MRQFGTDTYILKDRLQRVEEVSVHGEKMVPLPLNMKYITPGVGILCILALNGLVFLALRFIFGIGSVTNLNNQYPWGLWIGVDVAAGVALAAGGFTTAALGHVMHRSQYHSVIRPALLTAMLGYTFVALGVFTDIGRFYYIWHPLIMWNGNSALFEVGICVMIYMSVLYIEFLPIITERFIGRVNLKFKYLNLKFLEKPIENLLKLLDIGLDKTIFIFIIAGVVLSTLHQSSLGTLMVIAGNKMHPLWQSPILPLLFLISAIAVGLPMVIFESLIASRSFKMKPEINILSKLGSLIGPILFIYLAFKLGDMFIRRSFLYFAFDVQTIMFITEIVFGIIIPLFMFFQLKKLKQPMWLFISSTLVIAGVLLGRINNFIIAYKPPNAEQAYFPSVGELSVTVGCIALLVLFYRFIVIHFPVISREVKLYEM